MKKLLLSNWHFMRILRLGTGIFFAINAIKTHDSISGIISVFLLFQALTNTGCCGVNGCSTIPNAKKDTDNSKEIEYEEIK
ncbi:MAG: hypothetical protein HY951_00280 [Bacteroidia bacterium]|nr:hypothetical protein [Bacteroidia bacterium]